MKGFVQDIESIAVKNEEFRRVLYTAKHVQLVVMALKPKEEIGAEVHKLDQFFRVEEGTGETSHAQSCPQGRERGPQGRVAPYEPNRGRGKVRRKIAREVRRDVRDARGNLAWVF